MIVDDCDGYFMGKGPEWQLSPNGVWSPNGWQFRFIRADQTGLNHTVSSPINREDKDV